MSGPQIRETPLAWSQAGDAFDVPDTAVLWRVRRLSGNTKGGAPELVYGADGLPMMLDITIGPADFMEAVEGKPGKYRLDALDELRKPVAGVPAAYFVVSASTGARSDRSESPSSDVAMRTLAEAFKHQSDRLGDAFKQQSDQFSGLIAQVREFAQFVVMVRPAALELPPTSGGAAPAPRNGAEDEDDEEDEDDDQNGDGEGADGDGTEGASRPPDLFDRVQDFCVKVPPQNLRVVGEMVGEMGPKLIGDGIRNVIKEGLAGFVGGDEKPGGES